MPTTIRLAKTTGELNDVLHLRYKVLKEQGVSLSSVNQFTEMILDHLDILPTTLNLIAYRNGDPIATLRACEYVASDSFLNLSFDYSESVRQMGGTTVLFDMLVLGHQPAPDIVLVQLFKSLLSLLAHKNTQNALFNCPAEITSLLVEIGFKEIGDSFFCENLGCEIVPLVIDVKNFFDQLIEGIIDKEILRFQEVFYTSIFEPGEILIVEGEKGNTAYLIESGEVEILIRRGDELMAVTTIGRGKMIGEVALVTNETRTASLVAKNMTSCISFDRHDFMKLMYQEPHRSLDIFKIFSKRLNESNKRLAEAKR